MKIKKQGGGQSKKVTEKARKQSVDIYLQVEYTEENMRNFEVDTKLEFTSVTKSDVKRVIEVKIEVNITSWS